MKKYAEIFWKNHSCDIRVIKLNSLELSKCKKIVAVIIYLLTSVYSKKVDHCLFRRASFRSSFAREKLLVEASA